MAKTTDKRHSTRGRRLGARKVKVQTKRKLFQEQTGNYIDGIGLGLSTVISLVELIRSGESAGAYLSLQFVLFAAVFLAWCKKSFFSKDNASFERFVKRGRLVFVIKCAVFVLFVPVYFISPSYNFLEEIIYFIAVLAGNILGLDIIASVLLVGVFNKYLPKSRYFPS